MWFLFMLLIIKAFFHQSQSEGLTYLDSDEVFAWTPPYTKTATLEVEFEEGYTILVTVKELEVSGEDKDYLLIKPGKSDDGNGGRIFTYKLKSERKYQLLSNTAYFHFEVNERNDDLKGVTLTYQRYGDAVTTTTESATTAINWPTPASSDKIYYLASMSGHHLADYSNPEKIREFQTALMFMATEYCNIQGFLLSEAITLQNVHIKEIMECPYNWPDQQTCVRVRFALPVFVKDPKLGYQLTADHLENMWLRLSDKYLEKYGLTSYLMPDSKKSFTIWIVLASVIIVLFFLLLVLIRCTSRKLRTGLFRQFTAMQTSPEAKRDSDNSYMYPHNLQVMPPFCEPEITLFEPNKRIAYEPEDTWPS